MRMHDDEAWVSWLARSLASAASPSSLKVLSVRHYYTGPRLDTMIELWTKHGLESILSEGNFPNLRRVSLTILWHGDSASDDDKRYWFDPLRSLFPRLHARGIYEWSMV